MRGDMFMKRVKAFIVVLTLLTFLTYPMSAMGINVRDILRGGALVVGGGALVKAIAGPINDFINTITLNR